MPHRPSSPPSSVSAPRARFTAAELATVLSHWDLGVIDRVRDFPRGSRQSPKVRLRAAAGDLLLKRRGPGRDDPRRVAFTHAVQRHLHAAGFPVPRLLERRDGTGTALELHGRVYELFEFIAGTRPDGGEPETAAAGAALAQLHDIVGGLAIEGRTSVGGYHAAGVETTFDQLADRIAAADDAPARDDVVRLVEELRAAYADAGARAEAAGMAARGSIVVHGDWHPGNLLLREGRVVAVLDFDSARREARIADVANGALQFSMRMRESEDPRRWPEGVSAGRIRAFLRGYDSAAAEPIGAEERAALPWLMIEALIVEGIVPIAATGRFGSLPGGPFLEMIRAKVGWLRPRAGRLVEFLENGA